MKRKLFSLFLTALLCMSLIAVPASAQSNENEEPLPPLTPEGNMNLVDDMVTSSGKQFITVTTRDGNYFYIIIDRDDNGNQTVHFLNQVDEADLLDLLDEDELKDYTESQKPTEPAPTEQVQTQPTEPPVVTEEKGNSNFAALLPVVLLAAGGIGGFIMLSSSKKKSQQVKPDPDADYQEDDEFELPEDSYDEE
ncbi:MAG: CD1107 family mobile element protein [Faecousia sp.]